MMQAKRVTRIECRIDSLPQGALPLYEFHGDAICLGSQVQVLPVSESPFQVPFVQVNLKVHESKFITYLEPLLKLEVEFIQLLRYSADSLRTAWLEKHPNNRAMLVMVAPSQSIRVEDCGDNDFSLEWQFGMFIRADNSKDAAPGFEVFPFEVNDPELEPEVWTKMVADFQRGFFQRGGQ